MDIIFFGDLSQMESASLRRDAGTAIAVNNIILSVVCVPHCQPQGPVHRK